MSVHSSLISSLSYIHATYVFPIELIPEKENKTVSPPPVDCRDEIEDNNVVIDITGKYSELSSPLFFSEWPHCCSEVTGLDICLVPSF